MSLADAVREKAVALARSGRFMNCFSIELQLDNDGFPEVYVVLHEPELRAEINALCDAHWSYERATPFRYPNAIMSGDNHGQ
jgi:hypothetical protein